MTGGNDNRMSGFILHPEISDGSQPALFTGPSNDFDCFVPTRQPVNSDVIIGADPGQPFGSAEVISEPHLIGVAVSDILKNIEQRNQTQLTVPVTFIAANRIFPYKFLNF